MLFYKSVFLCKKSTPSIHKLIREGYRIQGFHASLLVSFFQVERERESTVGSEKNVYLYS